ncbi:MAG: hypothetical protein F4039_09145 [Gammaproteobacteria bacterium]|nr:hypothetical protein [Gammaproteobacteria bacterium]MXX94937.1 hypothetical protein [Gammaproteobacteria bacterium]MYF52356.1 hypothetical protein [Gammaproteobacteria bacterium]MYK44236.1 hypothetical protein [Gammaproteobacteria bacterium]
MNNKKDQAKLNITKDQQAELDKAVKGMLNLGALPKGYKRPKTAPKIDKNRRFKLDATPGKEKIVECES